LFSSLLVAKIFIFYPFFINFRDTLGVIFAFKNTRYSSTEKKDAGTDVSFSPHQRNSNYLVTSALLDIFYNKNVNVVSLNHIASSKAGKDRRTVSH
jgi:hypothetical protein